MVNPSLIFTICILAVITVLFLIAAFTGILGRNPYVLQALLVLTAWGFALWLVIGYHPEWSPYRTTNPAEAINANDNRNYNRELFYISLIVLIMTTLIFVVLLMFAINHKTPSKKSRTHVMVRSVPSVISEEKPVITQPHTTVPTSQAVPTITSQNRKLLDQQLGAVGTPTTTKELLAEKEERREEKLIEELQLEQALAKSDTGIDVKKLQADIKKKQQEIQAGELSGTITPEEVLTGTRVAQAKLKKGQEALKTATPSVYLSRPMFGSDVRMGTE